MRDMALHYKVELTPEAKADLRGVHEYITREFYDSETARKQSDRILKAAETLAVFPKLYRVRKRNTSGQEFRYMPVDNFVIIYTVDDSKHIVNVLHILYGRRNFENIL